LAVFLLARRRGLPVAPAPPPEVTGTHDAFVSQMSAMTGGSAVLRRSSASRSLRRP